MNLLNLKLQGKDNLIYDPDIIIEGFRRYVSLFEAQLEGGHFSHFQCFKYFRAGYTEDVNLQFEKKFIHDLNMQIFFRDY